MFERTVVNPRELQNTAAYTTAPLVAVYVYNGTHEHDPLRAHGSKRIELRDSRPVSN